MEEGLPLPLHVLGLFFGHGPADHIRLAQGVTGQLLEDLDDLLLIHDAAVGSGEDRLQTGVLIGHQLGVVLTGHEPGDGVHGAGAVQGDDGGDVLDVLGLQPQAHTGHAGGLHLEHAAGFALGQHIEGGLVVHGNVRQAEIRVVLLDHFHRIVQHRQVPQTQKVHFQQAQLLQRHHGILAHDGFVVPGQGNVFVHRPLGDDHAGGVGGGVPGHSLQGPGGVDELLDPGVLLVQVRQLLGQLQRIVQGDVRPGRHQLGHGIRFGVGHVQHPAHVPEGGPGRHGAEGDDLGHMVVAVFAADIVHHLAPAGVAEIHVDIRHGDTLRVQEALKIQAVLHGVDVRDAQAVGHHAAGGGAAARAHRDPRALGIVDEVLDDEEIVREAHFSDHVQLIVQLPVIGGVFAVACPEATLAQLPQIGGGVVPLRQLELRQVILAEGEVKPAAVGNTLGVLHGLGITGEQLLHLLRGADVEILRLIAHTVLIVHGFSGLDAQQHIVAFGVLLPEIVGVVGADQGNARLLVQAQQAPVHRDLLGNAVILKLQIEVALAQNVLHGQGIFLGPVIVAVYQAAGNFSGQAGGQADKALRMPAQQVQINAGLDIEPVYKGLAHQVRQIPVSRFVFAQQHQMTGFGVQLIGFVQPGAPGHIYLAADDRMDALGLAGPIEVDGAVHNAVVRDGHSRLPQLLYQLRQVPDAAGAVQQAVLRVDVQMGKGHITPPPACR